MKQKITSLLDKLYEGLKDNLPFILMFVILFLLLFFQHRSLAMYHDDFGNASLSYNQTSEHIIGTNYTIKDLVSWCNMIYNSWGGRILYAAVFLIPLLKFGITVYMLLQCFVITFIFYYLYKIVVLITKKKTIMIPIVLTVLYTLISMEYLRHGVYWASASILYIWPLLPLFSFIYYFIKLTEKIKEKKKVNYFFYLPFLCLLNFFAVFSQEQIGTSFLVFLILYILLCHGKEIKEYLLLDIPNILVALIGYTFLIVAPGNFVRLDANVEFASLSVFGKVMRNLPIILRDIFASHMQIFVLLFTILFLICLYKNKKTKQNKIVNKANLIFIIISCFYFIFQKIVMQQSFINGVVGSIYGIIWIAYIGIIMIWYGKQTNKISIVILSLAGCASVFCLVLSPVVGGRTLLPFLFYIFLLIVIFIAELLKESTYLQKLLLVIGVCFVGCFGIVNYYKIYQGYLENYEIEKLNFEILKMKKLEENEVVTLYKAKDSYYGSTRSYEDPSIEYWIKEYFAIPQSVRFTWVDLYKNIR